MGYVRDRKRRERGVKRRGRGRDSERRWGSEGMIENEGKGRKGREIANTHSPYLITGRAREGVMGREGVMRRERMGEDEGNENGGEVQEALR